jgi:hypothetical protein
MAIPAERIKIIGRGMKRRTEIMFRNDVKASVIRGFCVVAGLAFVAACGCSSSAKSGSAGQDSASSGAGGQIDVMCLGDRINNPPEPFHYSFKYADASNAVIKEADITPQAMDITTTDKSGSSKYHGVRSNEVSWDTAVLDLSSLNITAMAARLGSISGSSAVASQGAESKNGYQTTKYAIDTGSANASDRKTYETLFGAGSFEKGTIWMGQDSCAVQLVLDEAAWQTNGSVEKRHFEMARSKK